MSIRIHPLMKPAFLSALLLAVSIPSAWATPAQVLIIRHAEKDASGGLSEQGEERAKALVSYFETNPAVTRFGTPVAIFAMTPKKNGKDTRPVNTVTPLAIALGLAINEDFKKKEEQALAHEILTNPDYEGRMVLVCWEHKVIAELASSLGVTPVPEDWPSSVFDQVWEIDYSGNDVSDFKEFQQAIALP